eukprot:COSAG02_NODE_3525_length_6615_cov_2.025629_4_plen_74_part_00
MKISGREGEAWHKTFYAALRDLHDVTQSLLTAGHHVYVQVRKIHRQIQWYVQNELQHAGLPVRYAIPQAAVQA